MTKTKLLIEKIKEDYDTTLTAIAEKLVIKRSMLYSMMKKEKFSDMMMEQLMDSYPDSFDEVKPIKEEVEATMVPCVMDDEGNATFFEDEAVETTATIKTKKYNKPLKNCWCLEKCYFVKVRKEDYEKIKPRCPICNEEMLTKEDRLKAKKGQTDLFSTDDFEGL